MYFKVYLDLKGAEIRSMDSIIYKTHYSNIPLFQHSNPCDYGRTRA
jgi:hypothetical protein